MKRSKAAPLHQSERRRLLAVLAADIVAYSRLMAENEDDMFYRLQDLNASVVTPCASRNHGRIVKWTGNGFISIFDSAVDAVRAAIEIQSGVAAAGASTDKERRIRLRIGVSAGDVITVPGDVFGDTVNVAARLQNMAAPGNICISRAVRDAVRGKFNIEFEERGDLDLKNDADPVGMFRVVFDPIAWTMTQEITLPAERGGGRWRQYALGGVLVVALAAAVTVWSAPNGQTVQAAAPPPSDDSEDIPIETVPSAAAAAIAPGNAAPGTAAPGTAVSGTAVPGTVAPAAAATDTPSFAEALNASLSLALPGLGAGERQEVVRGYEAAQGHKAQAVSLQPPGLWRSAERPSAGDAASSALEDCQIYYNAPCVLVALDEAISPVPPGGKWPTHDMPRVRYSGSFDPVQIPGTPPETRTRADILAYRAAPGPKAAAFHPHGGRIFTTSGAANQQVAEEAALRACNADPQRDGKDGPCFLYAVGNDVVLERRLTTPPPGK